MRTHTVLLAMLACLGTSITAADDHRFTENATFETLAITPLAIEGLTGDEHGNLYTTGRAPLTEDRCPLWQIDPGGAMLQVGSIGNAAPGCGPSGITRDRHGSFYIADSNQGGVIWKLTAANMNPSSPFVTGVPGTNGVAFDRHGNLWTGDGTTGQGRVWRITRNGTVTEVFRIQPMRNSTALGGTVAGDGVGRQARTFPPGTSDDHRARESNAYRRDAGRRSGPGRQWPGVQSPGRSDCGGHRARRALEGRVRREGQCE